MSEEKQTTKQKILAVVGDAMVDEQFLHYIGLALAALNGRPVACRIGEDIRRAVPTWNGRPVTAVLFKGTSAVKLRFYFTDPAGDRRSETTWVISPSRLMRGRRIDMAWVRANNAFFKGEVGEANALRRELLDHDGAAEELADLIDQYHAIMGALKSLLTASRLAPHRTAIRHACDLPWNA